MGLFASIILMICSPDIFRCRGKTRDRKRMTEFIAGKSSQTGEYSSGSLTLASETDSTSGCSSGGFADSGHSRRESDSQRTENTERTENKNLRKQVTYLKKELDKTLDGYERALRDGQSQRRETVALVSATLARFVPNCSGYDFENGRLIYSWESKQREQRDENVRRHEDVRRAQPGYSRRQSWSPPLEFSKRTRHIFCKSKERPQRECREHLHGRVWETGSDDGFESRSDDGFESSS